MLFNQFIWNNFKETQKGKSIIDFFRYYRENLESKTNLHVHIDIAKKILHLDIDWTDDELVQTAQGITDMGNSILLAYKDITGKDVHIDNFEDFQNFYMEVLSWVDPQSNIPFIFMPDDTQSLYYLYPQYCFPYYFYETYYHIEAIFKEFGIFLPPTPKKNDHEGRRMFYLELCKSLYDFRSKHEMNEYELPAFLYGFATEIVRKYEIKDALPVPKRAFFVGGGKKAEGIDASSDFEYLDSVDNNSMMYWQGNLETQPGDIVVMYCLSPRSYIHSIWRAVTPGFIEPFAGFYKRVYIGKPTVVNPISLDELKADEILSQMPLIKGNMQGINGRVIDKVYYDRLLALLKEKGCSTECIPRLADDEVLTLNIKNEKDVEQYLLEPLLEKLGYTQSDWKRQFKLRMGRGDRVYPDYVISPNEERNNESGYWVWEAKHSVQSNKQLQEDFGQVKSYARALNCKGLGLVSKEGVWIAEAASDFNFDKHKFWSWKQIGESDSFSVIYAITGNKTKL